MIKILKFLKPYWLWIITFLVLVVIYVVATLQLPDYMAKIINQGILPQDNSVVWHTGLLMLGVSLLGGIATIGVNYYASRIGSGFAKDVRTAVFSKVEDFSLTEFNRFSTSSLITRSTNDIQQIQMVLIMVLRQVVQAPLMGAIAVAKAYHTAPSLSWIIALAVILMLGLIITVFSIAMPRFQLLQKLIDKLNLVTRENLTGLRVIRAFNNEKIQEKKFDDANRTLTDTNLFVNRLMVVMFPALMLLFNFAALGIIWYGAKLVSINNLEIGNMLAFMQYAMQIIGAFLMFSFVFIIVPRASVSIKRVMAVINTKPEIKDPDKPIKPTKSSGLVEFKNVTFSYPVADIPVLYDISFTAKPGQTTAIIGSTGSGKSTMINLIPRFYDVTSGHILIDGVDVRDYKLENLYTKIGYVPQRGVLFSGSVESNIKYGAPRAKESVMTEAARISQSTEFIGKLGNSFEAPVSQGGANLSGGQKQRLSIARAIAIKPEIYIFDDSFSALDFKTDLNLRTALAKEVKQKTVLIVAQRISTILSADKIIVMNDGKIVGQGNHKKLMKENKVYQEIAASQLSEEELKAYQVGVDRQKTANLKMVEGGAK
ncbi:multidrug ABC transporter ATP-binding protein [Candidatus Berkelbacteria bacterium CG10_big_fil_rev_8_21_14_0_10_43_13]|uniref:Multidrug ABC transporter ATP-binding protein n=1 Tax=Candidatus Berkelbacteria bacterium CG10_big_fil_rev_8_21_14_0_10_43_13 TaxID=1974514 RepID=A0A2H0W6P1_9BACT|nr:MAG: multidrug ABC transporter ATP-binding protein [Candidatus Berkelbacteria bacterium CG10_big_fil_rev_8_21_14_0_10_43_13]